MYFQEFFSEMLHLIGMSDMEIWNLTRKSLNQLQAAGETSSADTLRLLKNKKTNRSYGMSQENVKKFYEALKNSKEMVEEWHKLVDSSESKTSEKSVALLVQFAAEKGYEFTAEDLKMFESETRELDADELNEINAAGASVKLEYCVGCPWW